MRLSVKKVGAAAPLAGHVPAAVLKGRQDKEVLMYLLGTAVNIVVAKPVGTDLGRGRSTDGVKQGRDALRVAAAVAVAAARRLVTTFPEGAKTPEVVVVAFALRQGKGLKQVMATYAAIKAEGKGTKKPLLQVCRTIS